ncbi:hypothetical protein [Erythrobacter mangrovi]|uniref:Uncharacterized protein n=1 Tax=Erythrobacter mangrovi TaxID=2739433 RepID=A0A7D4BNX4_9SPHN|nr:hypothetical protein [Erythrobacter mangrovi]QKG71424.1 hypothetical protein HQR01_08630 [Erythrobacter mangrovi]
MTQSRFAAIGLAIATIPLTACVIVPDAPIVEGTPMPEGTAVALRVPVMVGDVVATPMKVIEDSRCPINARCVWAGRLIVETRIDGAGWRDTANITLGESYGTHGRVVRLVSGEPNKTTDREVEPSEYRFTYEAGQSVARN